VKKIVIDPVTRIEGHLKIEVTVDKGEIKNANMSGTLFRGIETILKGRDPRDAVILSQRICGVCPEPHAIASVSALEDCTGLSDKIPENGILMRNIIQATRTIADHILHFYILSGLDYLDVSKVLEYKGNNLDLNNLKLFLKQGYSGPFLPRDEIDYKLDTKITNEIASHYLKALDIYRKAQKMATIFGGKWPHDSSIVIGGVSEQVTSTKIHSYLWRLNELEDFVKNYYLPDVITVAKAYNDYFEIGRGCQKLLAFESYKMKSNGDYNDTLFARGLVKDIDRYESLNIDNISENVKRSWYLNSPPLNPIKGLTEPMTDKNEAYSWVKSPRYNNKVYETGPLSSLLATYLSKNNAFIKNIVKTSLSEINIKIPNLYSVMGRHLSRALIANILCNYLRTWIQNLKVGESTATDYTLTSEGIGVGLTTAPRGALGHWLEVKYGRISNYQVITPTTWNVSPKDENGNPGPCEQALIGTKIRESKNPIEILRIIRSFDPCMACAVHLITAKGYLLGKYKVV
jgi:hydrogenase large subunit